MSEEISLNELLEDQNIDEKIKELSFEDGLKLLEELVEKVESGSLSLDKAVLSYEKGVALINRLRELLSGAEEKLKILNK
ncbi:MAG: exodeoxyribonuclease VII small subunit [Candidatus Dadabacteria bacterium]|nr:MAG: exodeoxyribonuclease VII small subunit [Candidatus Dadabacteria bacterium]